jgi:hypothetical protein
MYSCSKRLIPWQMAASISPSVFMMSSNPSDLADEKARALNVAELAGPNRAHSSHVIFIIQGSQEKFTCYFLLTQDNDNGVNGRSLDRAPFGSEKRVVGRLGEGQSGSSGRLVNE